MAKQTLKVLTETFAIHSLDVDADIPKSVLECDLYFLGKTRDELSIVIPQSIKIKSEETDFDWRVLEVLGPLSLSMVGIMAQIGNVLANANVSIFVVSTFETDFFLVKQTQLDDATIALKKAGYNVTS